MTNTTTALRSKVKDVTGALPCCAVIAVAAQRVGSNQSLVGLENACRL
jgi:hypothetical protein